MSKKFKEFTPHPECSLSKSGTSPVLYKVVGEGFTLVELIISIGIIALIGSVISQVFFQTTRSNAKVEIQKEVKQNGDYAIEVMQRMIHNSLAVTSSCTSTGFSGQTLTITNPDFGSTTFACDNTSGTPRIASVSALGISYLTTASVTLGGTACATSTYQTVCTTLNSHPYNVKINFTLSQTSTSPDIVNQATQSFQTFVTIRNFGQ